jgi:hypothetical protein
MNGMLNLLFISVLMNAFELVAMEPKRNSPATADAASLGKSRRGRVITKAVERSNPITIVNSRPRRVVNVIGLSKPSKLENHKKLVLAIQSGEIGQVLELLHNKVDVNYCDDQNNTPLLCAIFMSHQEDDTLRMISYVIVQKLLENRAEVNPRCNNPMQVAQLMGNKDIIRLLLLYGANVHECKHTIKIGIDEKDQLHNYMGSVRTLRQNWQCECGICTYWLQDEHDEDRSLRSKRILKKRDFGLTPEEVAEVYQKQDEEKRKRMLAKFAQEKPVVIRDQKGYYRDMNEPPEKFDLLMRNF